MNFYKKLFGAYLSMSNTECIMKINFCSLKNSHFRVQSFHVLIDILRHISVDLSAAFFNQCKLLQQRKSMNIDSFLFNMQ